ncbi:hypothetical protein SAMN05421747_10354 [Parapedobacter composti]|uniref:Uncharacterized protein n=1 Tax=Parapedobacter composti TaxID=623281 RepID=A0A1I1FUB7_9SPHI|nr:hypothetical protein SAMN05421747_10354 [Parapedobacter composti]
MTANAISPVITAVVAGRDSPSKIKRPPTRIITYMRQLYNRRVSLMLMRYYLAFMFFGVAKCSVKNRVLY